ncbi:MAG: hypothetical protein J6T24_02510 [Clostridia bacterium]|nr:hypothetical protein [Clostridia bacterium]
MSKDLMMLPFGETLNYFCTWATQNRVGEEINQLRLKDPAFTGDQGSRSAREQMNEEFVFGKDGVVHLWEKVRSSLYLLLDDGWDVPYGIDPATQISLFGSLEIDKERFPSLKGTPAERLKQMNERVIAAGWRGLGIWVSPQRKGMQRGEEVSLDEMRDYWRERLEWSKHAGVRYWKVDWGMLSMAEYRKCLTDLAAEVYPELYVEQARSTSPINGEIGTEKVRFSEGTQAEGTARNYADSRVFRSYDVTDDYLSATTTLDRLAFLFSRDSGGFINCEDELYIGAALGCSVGVMRSHFGAVDFRFCRRLQEVEAAVRWLDIAPPFSGGTYLESPRLLYDSCYFSNAATWYSPAREKTVTQAAPAVMARNTPLPEVKAGENAPFVVASLNPSMAYSIAAIRRFCHLMDTEAPEVTCPIGKAERIGIFGNFASLTFKPDTPPTRITAQCLFGTVAEDVTECVLKSDGRIVVDGALLAKIGTATDESEPAVMLTLYG